MQKNIKLKNKLLISTAMAGVSFFSYGRQAYANLLSCVNTSGTSYLCSGTAFGSQDLSDKDNANVSTSSGFSVNTGYGNAITITGDGALSFTDTYSSTITSTDSSTPGNGLSIVSGTEGTTLTIDADSNITGYHHGVYTYNNGTGATSITLDGDVTGTNSHAIYIKNTSSAGSLTINTGSAGTLTGYNYAIKAINNGKGDTSINLNGNVYGEVYAYQKSSSTADLNVITGTGSYVTSAGTGNYFNFVAMGAIYAVNKSTYGQTNITINGDVNGVGTSAIKSYNAPIGSRHIGNAYRADNSTNIIINGSGAGTLIKSNSNAAITNYSDWGFTNGHYPDFNVTLNGNYAAVTITGNGNSIEFVAGDNTLNINGTVNINGNVTASGSGNNTVNLGITTLTLGGGSNFSGFNTISLNGTADITSDSAFAVDGSALQVKINSDSNYGKMTDSSGIIFSNRGSLTIDAASLRSVIDGTTLRNVFSGGTVTGITAGVLDDNSDYYTFTSVIDGDNIDILIQDEEHVFAGCHNTSGTNYVCDSANTAMEDFGGKDNTSVTTASGFSVETEFGHAVKVTGDGSLSFTDTHASTITTTDDASGLYIKANTGSISVNANSNITSVNDGVLAINNGTGASSVTLDGIVTSLEGNGLHVYNAADTTGLTINTGSASNIFGYNNGIFANNLGSGGVSITIAGDVTGVYGSGINARSYTGSSGITINTGSASNVTGYSRGIYVRNYAGAASITVNGSVSATNGRGIYAINVADATNIAINTGSLSSISGPDIGIYAINHGTGTTDITVNGDVNSENGRAVQTNVGSNAGNVTINIGSASHITGAYYGIATYNHGTGKTTININGSISGDVLVSSYENTTGISITTSAGSYINSVGPEVNSYAAIYANNHSTTGDTDITINGNVTGTNSPAILVNNLYTDTNITINGSTGGTKVKSTGEYAAITSLNDTAMNITLNGTDGDVTITGGSGTAIDFQDANDTLVISGNVNINGDVTGGDGTDTLNIGTSKITMGDSSSFSGFEAVNVTGAMTLQAGKTITIGSTTPIAVNGGSLKVAVNSADSYGKLVGTSGAEFSNGGAITVDASSIGTIANDTTLSNVFSGGPVTGITAGLLSDNSITYKFTSVVNDNSIDILVENNSSLTSTSTNASGVASTLDKITNSGGGDEALQTVISTINNFSSPEQQAAAVKTLAPDVSGSNTTGTIAITEVAIGTIESHMQTALEETSGTGIATGDKTHTKGLWAQVFGKDISQGYLKGVDGYDADVAGFTVGADSMVGSNSRAGGALSYASTSAKSLSSNTDIDSVQATIYGTYDFGKLYYESLGAASINHFTVARTLFDSSVANSDYDSYQFTAKAGIGYREDFGAFKVTPFASLQYGYIMQPDYTETGSSAPLSVKNNDLEIFKTGFGTKARYDIAANGMTYSPHVSAGWYYDFINDTAETTSNFTSAAGSTFISHGATPNRSTFNFGSGLDILTIESLTLSMDYDCDIHDSFRAHTGKAKVRWEF